MAEAQALSLLFSRFIDWARLKKGAENLKDHPGLWTAELGDWRFALNGHGEEVEGVPPYHVRITHEVYLAIGIVGPFGGCAMPGMEDDLIALFDAELAA